MLENAVFAHRASGLFWLGLFVFLLTAIVYARAQDDNRRIALVIGNANYPNAAEPLPNAIKDAKTLSKEFGRLNFSVQLKQDLRANDLRAAVDAFIKKVGKGSTAVFYFSGFGLQVARQSYLIPVNAQIWGEADVRRDGISVDALVAAMHHKGAKATIVIIDAARRNPFERRFRNVAAGLAPLNAPVDTLVLYSGALNRVIAERSSGDHSLFAAQLIRELRTSKLTMEEIFNRVRIGVSRASGGDQVPWVASSLRGNFDPGAAASAAPAASARDLPAPPISPVNTAAPESSEAASAVPESVPVSTDAPKPSPAPAAIPDSVPAATPPSPPEAPAPAPTQMASLPPPTDDCDRLAANPYDPGKTVGGVQFKELQPSRAIDACRNALAAHPGTPRFQYQLGRALQKAQSYKEAMAEYRNAADKGYAAAMANMGLMYFWGQGVAKDYDHAIAEFTRALRINPKSVQVYNARGFAYATKGNQDRAIADYSESIRLDPKFAIAYNNRGNSYRIKRDYDRAIADYTEAIRINPGYAFAHYNRGLVYGNKGDYDRAIANFSEAIRIDPKLVVAYNDRGNAYNAKHDYDRAIANFTAAIRLNPKFAVGYNNRGNTYRAKKDYDRAFADYGMAIRLDPEYATAYFNRASAFMDRQKYSSAIEDCTEAIRLVPDSAPAYVMRGRAYRALRRYKQAIADYDEAIRRDRNLAIAYSDRGFAYRATGQKTEAIADFRKALDLNPSDAAAKDALARLSLAPGEIPDGAIGPRRHGFAAIAYSPQTGRWGESYGYGNKRSALRRAVVECGGSKQGCEAAVWYRKSCGGVAADAANGAWAPGSGPTAKSAALAAVKACTKKGGHACELVRVGCTR